MRLTDARRRLPAALVLALLLASCGASGEGGAKTDSTTTTDAKTSTTRAKSTTTAGRETTTTTSDEGPTKAQLEAFIDTALLAPDDVSVDGLVATTPRLSPTAPCGLRLETEFPSEAIGNVTLASDSKGIALQETIRVYATEADASDAYQAVLDTGLGCSESTDGSTKIISGGDMSAAVAPPGVDLEAEVFGLDSAEFQGSAYAIHSSDRLVVLQFISRPGAAELGGLPDIDVVTMAAMAKIDSSIPG